MSSSTPAPSAVSPKRKSPRKNKKDASPTSTEKKVKRKSRGTPASKVDQPSSSTLGSAKKRFVTKILN